MSTSVLIIDPDANFARAVQAELEVAGFSVTWAHEASLDRVRSSGVPEALVLSDELPQSSGLAFCSRLRRDGELGAVPILVLSQAPKDALDAHARRPERANLYASKPIQPEAVTHLVQQMLESVPPPLHPKAAAPRTDQAHTAPDPVHAEPDPSLGRVQTFRDALENTLRVDPEERSTRRGSPEERTDRLRTLVKREQGRNRELERIARDVLAYVDDLSSRLVSSQGERKQFEDQLAAEREAAQQLQAKLEETEHSFHSFHDEVTRIFTDKDREEQALLEQLEVAEVQVKEQAAALSSMEDNRQDDSKRLSFLQEELESLNAELVKTHQQLTEERARSAGFEADALQKAESLSALEARLDDLRVSTEEGRAQSDQRCLDLETELQAQEAEHAQRSDKHRAEKQALEQALQEAKMHLDSVSTAFDATQQKLKALEVELAESRDEADAHGESVLELRVRLDSLQAELSEARRKADGVGPLQSRLQRVASALEAEQQTRGRLAEQLERTRTELSRLREAEAARNRELATKTGELRAAKLALSRGRISSAEPVKPTSNLSGALGAPAGVPSESEEEEPDATEVFSLDEIDST